MIFMDRRTDNEWALSVVDKFPRSWQSKLIVKWHKEHQGDYREANLTLLGRVRKLADSARGGISPDANDHDICQQADITARDFRRRVERVETIARNSQAAFYWGDRFVERVKRLFVRALLKARGLLDLWPRKGPKDKRVSDSGALARVLCARWWRRTYRKLHARTVEASAIGIGLVSKAAGLYASDDAVKRRRGQNARNAAALESVHAVNDHFQAYTLAELAAKGTANKAIRRVELLTRIAGFELIAKELKHIAYMVTVSCPSRFHACTTRGGVVKENPKYKGATPDEAQRYLSRQWGRCRAAAMRAGIDWYGFRIAEPQHDGTPHWHMLLFMPAGGNGTNYRQLVRLVRRYFWRNDSPDESGAKKHRVDFERIDWSKGSAVGYVIKYVSKNIDGYGVGIDLFGGDAITSSQRVEAWASTHRIRQFQQIGGAPVGVWRELRRLDADNLGDSAPDALRAAVSAVNAQKIEPGVASLAWRKYIKAQGGIGTPRALQKIRLMKEQTGECGRYGEAMGPRAVGIEASGVHRFRDAVHVLVPHTPMFERPAFAEVESERAAWHISMSSRESAEAEARRVFGIQRSAASTWIHVNNCTRPPAVDHGGRRILTMRQLHGGEFMPTEVSAFAPVSEYRAKLRRFRGWREKPTHEGSKNGNENESKGTYSG